MSGFPKLDQTLLQPEEVDLHALIGAYRQALDSARNLLQIGRLQQEQAFTVCVNMRSTSSYSVLYLLGRGSFEIDVGGTGAWFIHSMIIPRRLMRADRSREVLQQLWCKVNALVTTIPGL